MSKFLGYCFDENDRYDKATEIENEGDAMQFLMHNLSKCPRVLITDMLDCTVLETKNGEIVLPSKEMRKQQEQGKCEISIYQLKQTADKNLSYANLKEVKALGLEIDANNYNRVWTGNVDTNNLELIFAKFNNDIPADFKGHSMSVSDIVELGDSCYFVDSFGFNEIEFDANIAGELEEETKQGKIKVLIVEPHKEPYVAEIGSDLKSMQAVVKGLIECIPLSETACLIGNEEAKLIPLEGNRRLGNDIIAGTFFIAGDNGDEFGSLSDADIEKYTAQFKEPLNISPEEVEDSICIEIIGFGGM